MLTIVGQEFCAQMDAEFGSYVPFKLRSQTDSGSSHFYWRTGDFESTLLEVEINPADGQLIGASLLLPGRVSRNFPTMNFPDQISDGSPRVCVDNWPDDRFLDEPGFLQVFVDVSRLLILISSSVAVRLVSAGNVTFGICASESLVWILVNGLNVEDLSGLAKEFGNESGVER
ncbi:hypothetical protein [Pseudomonas mediterranea]|uniref:hypothetical protein n=1 Tax=Pseudomonas mediterranea TaxID=183795 RepID=UPI00128EF5F5|nr:hypothetical protein [Pseudomonas mediterranea]MDU9030470.1 hypothetical protein [Pseudomonas mediterranea]